MDFRQPAFFFLKAVFGFSGHCGRRSRRDSFLSFQSLLADASALAGGDPFSHPSGSSVSRPAWVAVRSAAGGLSSTRSARPPPGTPGARKHSVPVRVHSVVLTWGSRPLSGSASNLALTHSLVESPKILSPGATPAAAGGRGDPPGPFSSAGSMVQTPLRAPDRSPLNRFSYPARRRVPHHRAHPPPSHATRPWPVCRPAPWSR